MSRTVPRAGGPNWLAAIVGAMALAVALALFTTPRTDSRYPSPALPPAAQSTVTAPTPAAPAAVTKATQVAGSASRPSYNMQAGQRIAIDPATGQIRPIEHDDVPLTVAPAGPEPEPQQVLYPSGVVGVTIPETADVYTVATKGPDGTVSIAHTDGRKAVNQIQQRKTRPAPAKEVLNDR
jgi:hypothetical protein